VDGTADKQIDEFIAQEKSFEEYIEVTFVLLLLTHYFGYSNMQNVNLQERY
jgi:hypothetical protein